jgi:DNA-binding MarR family transcriptional regulator
LPISKFLLDPPVEPGDQESTTPPAVAPPALEIDRATRLRVAIGRLSRRLRPTAAGTEAGLTPTRVSVLLHAVREGQTRLSEVAGAEGINPTMLSRVVGELVDAGLLERVSDERDRRAAWVKATPAGRRLAERMRRERTEAVDRALEELTATERQLIERALPALEALAEALGERRP